MIINYKNNEVERLGFSHSQEDGMLIGRRCFFVGKNPLYLLIIALLFVSTNYSFAEISKPNFFKKHIMVIVDQSPDAIRESDMFTLYSGIKSFLEGKDPKGIDMNKSDLPSNFEFDPETDEVSLYAFGLGGLHTGGDWDKIHNNASFNPQYTSDRFFNDISNGLIHHRSSFSESGKDFNEFLATDLKKLFYGQDPLANNFHGVTMSHYVYPTILNFIDSDSRAAEYYFVVVTNYKDGAGNADGADEQQIKWLAGRNVDLAGKYVRDLNNLKRPFYTINWMQMRSQDNPVNYVNGMQLGVKSLQGVSVNIASNVELEQTNLNRDVFEMKPVEISFNKNNSLSIDSIHLAVREAGGENSTIIPLTLSSREAESWFDADKRLFKIPGQKINLAGISDKDALQFEYQFYTTIVPEVDGKEIPYVFTTNTNISKDDIVFINDKRRNMIIALCIAGALIIFLLIMILRGRSRKLTASVHNFTTRFSMTTQAEGTIELPCWFVNEGQNSVGIRVDGSVTPKYKQPRMPMMDSLGVTIDNVKIPEGVHVCLNNNRSMVSLEGKYHTIPLENGKFRFTVNFWIDDNILSSSDPIRVQLKLRYKTVTKLGFLSHTQFHPDDPDNAELIEFYIKPEIGIGWMGIDPGTSGSCVAIGRGGTIAHPNIHLVTKENDKIIPSKLIFDKKTFSGVENAVPGEDYSYGVRAHQIWIAQSARGYKCFQSIKKLLGYQNGDNNRICITFPKDSNTQFELTGMEIARLLVRGLLNDTDDYINSLSTQDRNSLLPNGAPIRRAVVAIPNNYTLPKTLDMVKSVALSGRFEEVRPIFEAEAILCNYLSKTFGEISNGSRNIVVYDMGGATINLTVFRVDYHTKDGSIYYTIRTLGRIGYAVGGDNIDYALMRYIFSISGKGNDAKAREYQEANKVKILDEILRLKKNLISFDPHSNKPGEEMLSSFDAFNDFVRDVTGTEITNNKYLQYKISADEDDYSSQKFTRFIVDQLCSLSADITKFVKKRISEVSQEILSYPDVKDLSKLDLVIFSGRSVLFPNIKDWALKELKTKFSKLKVWNGLDDEDVKTAVAYGACWYGTFNSLVTLDNSRVASAYGFKLTQDGKTQFVGMIDQNAAFGGGQSISAATKVASNFASDGNIVEFFQIMGSPESEDLFDKKNRYKVNKIGEIPINVATEEISIEVKRSNMVDFGCVLENGSEIIKNDVSVSDRDITDENDEAYIFATYTPKAQNNN